MINVCLGQHQSTLGGWLALKSLLIEFASHFGKKLFLPRLTNGMLYELSMQNPQKTDFWTFLKMVRQSLIVASSWKGLSDILEDTEESDCQIGPVC